MNIPSTLRFALVLAGFTPTLPAAGTAAPGADPAAAYLQTVTARAEKIVSPMNLAEPAKAARVRDLIARQYADLRDLQEARDARLKSLRQQPETDKSAHEAALKKIHDEIAARVDRLHSDYLARLAAELTPAQIEQVKDGMTYGVLPLTFRVYQEMLPNLTAEQRAQIKAWLVEAREHAMDGFSSDEKHAWFGKYKGRINNYLAKAGIDMKQAEKDMLARQKAARTEK